MNPVLMAKGEDPVTWEKGVMLAGQVTEESLEGMVSLDHREEWERLEGVARMADPAKRESQEDQELGEQPDKEVWSVLMENQERVLEGHLESQGRLPNFLHFKDEMEHLERTEPQE